MRDFAPPWIRRLRLFFNVLFWIGIAAIQVLTLPGDIRMLEKLGIFVGAVFR